MPIAFGATTDVADGESAIDFVTANPNRMGSLNLNFRQEMIGKPF